MAEVSDATGLSRSMAGEEGDSEASRMIDKAKYMIEECILKYMTKEEAISALSREHADLPATTEVWDRLQQENPEFFEAYYALLELIRQIKAFNELLARQQEMSNVQAAAPPGADQRSTLPTPAENWMNYSIGRQFSGPNGHQHLIPSNETRGAHFPQHPMTAAGIISNGNGGVPIYDANGGVLIYNDNGSEVAVYNGNGGISMYNGNDRYNGNNGVPTYAMNGGGPIYNGNNSGASLYNVNSEGPIYDVHDGVPVYDGNNSGVSLYNGDGGVSIYAVNSGLPVYNGNNGGLPVYNGNNGGLPVYNGNNGGVPVYNGNNGGVPVYNGNGGVLLHDVNGEAPLYDVNGGSPAYDVHGGVLLYDVNGGAPVDNGNDSGASINNENGGAPIYNENNRVAMYNINSRVPLQNENGGVLVHNVNGLRQQQVSIRNVQQGPTNSVGHSMNAQISPQSPVPDGQSYFGHFGAPNMTDGVPGSQISSDDRIMLMNSTRPPLAYTTCTPATATSSGRLPLSRFIGNAATEQNGQPNPAG